MNEPRQCRCCRVPIAVGMLACRKHWYDLPRQVRERVLHTHRVGDRPSYVAAVRDADQVWRDLGVWQERSTDVPPEG